MVAFVVVPQWQGSASSRAMRLADGAAAIRDDLPASATHSIEVPPEAGSSLTSGIARFSSLATVRERLTDTLATLTEPAVVIGGDCSVSAAAIAHVAGDDLAVVWFDAHPDLNSIESSPSGAFSGMVLGSLLSDGTVRADHTVIAGARAWDLGEELYVAANPVRTLSVADMSDAAAVAQAVVATGATRVYIHVDLDVLDPSSFAGLLNPLPFGAEPATLVAAIRAIRSALPLAGATIASFAPESADASVDDFPTILRIIAALRG